jgi:3-isopropylmalate/(R)-2-methylmalate dehydratase large subunit
VSAKDVLLHLAGEYGDHVGLNMEFGGPGLAGLDIDQRRMLATMCAEVSAEFAIFECDDVLLEHFAQRGLSDVSPVFPDDDAEYVDVRRIDLGSITPMIGMPGGVVRNTASVTSLPMVRLNRAFVGSCSNGTLADLRSVAAVLDGNHVHPDVTFLVTPGSQQIYQEALVDGTIEKISAAGALVTTSSCGMCGGFVNALSAGDVCLSSSTRNFKGRMGSPDAEIYLGSSATVAASAIAGTIVDPRLRAGVLA